MSNKKIQTLSIEDDLEQLKQWAESYPEKQNLLTAGTGISIENNTISCTLDTTVFKVVDSLPTSDIDTNVIYIVPSDEPGEQNMYTEYIYVNGSWEKLGEFKANVDLSDYYTKEETYSSTEIDEKISTATEGGITSITASGSSPLNLEASVSGTTATITGSVDLSDYYTKSDADSLLDEKANASDVYTKSETYTQTEVNSMVSNIESHEVDVYSISGEAPLILTGTYTEADHTLTISGSVDAYSKSETDSTFATKDDVPTKTSELTNDSGFITSSDVPTLSDLGGVDSITASGTSPLTLDASKSGTSVTITGSVDLSDYATSSDIASKQDKLTAGDNITISGTTISATDTTYSNATTSTAGLMSSSDKSNLDSLISNSVTSATANGTSPLTLGASISGNVLSITGSVDTYDKETINEMISTAMAGGISSITASGSSPLTLNASVSGTSATITGSVDLSSKQDALTAGTGISISGSTISCTLDTDVFEVVTSLPTSGITNKIYCVPTSGETGEQNVYTEYLYINNSWEKIGEFHADVDMSNYYTKEEADLTFATIAEIPTVPTNVSAFTNDAGYITNSSIPTLSDLGGVGSITASGTSPLTLSASKSGTSVTISGSVDLSSKQDTLTAGENITISGSTISATDTTYSAGTNVQISSSNVISATDTTYSAGTNVQISSSNVISATDTTYSNATTSTAGLMSSSDKSNLDSLNSSAITSVTASGTSPLTLNASQTGNSLSITGSVDLEDLKQLIQDNADNIALIVELLTTIVGE